MAPRRGMELLECCGQSQLWDVKSWDGHGQHLAGVGPPFAPAPLPHAKGILK